jgi:8-oxo-dGTP diphosphatase
MSKDNSTRQHRHIGAYGICRVGDSVVLVRKARGPYTGLWDLPGGGIGFGEAPEAALRREFIEETGLVIASATLLRAASTQIRYVAGGGVEEELHHLGFLYAVSLEAEKDGLPTPKSGADGEDSDGAAWFLLSTIESNNLTPFASIALLG